MELITVHKNEFFEDFTKIEDGTPKSWNFLRKCDVPSCSNEPKNDSLKMNSLKMTHFCSMGIGY